MAVLTLSSKSGPNARTPVRNVLTASDTFEYLPGTGQELWLINTTAGALSPVITGSGAASNAPVAGGGTVNYAGGFPFGSIPAGSQRFVDLDVISQFLVGTITITGGTGLLAILANDA